MSRIEVYVTPKQGVLDPQGKAIESALKLKGFSDVKQIRVGKFIEMDMDDPSESKVKEICEKLLANTVIEDYRIVLPGSE